MPHLLPLAAANHGPEIFWTKTYSSPPAFPSRMLDHRSVLGTRELSTPGASLFETESDLRADTTELRGVEG